MPTSSGQSIGAPKEATLSFMKNLPSSSSSPKRGHRAAKGVVPKAKSVFISSTYVDLVDHRREVWRVLEGFKVAVRGMERFGARSQAPKETCLAEVEQCDVYVGIIGFRLGSIDPETGKYFTQLEYEHALKLNKEILIYLADEHEARFRKSDFDADQSRLEEFKKVLREHHTTNSFSTPEDLAENLSTDFAKRFQPVAEKVAAPETQFVSTLELVRRFRLLPRSVSGREIRLVIKPHWDTFPASRALCNAFNLEYGNTLGVYIRILKPEHEAMNGFKEIYASGSRVTEFLSLVATRSPVEIHARLQFSPDDVPFSKAEFFGYSYDRREPDLEDDPTVGYVAPEGRVILLFSKTAS